MGKQLLQNLKLQKRKLRRLRKCSTLKLLMLISRRDKTFSRRALTLSMGSLIPSMPIWLPCPSQFLRTRRKLLPRKLQLSRTSLRSMDALPPQSRRLRTLLLILLLLTTPLRQLVHGKMLQQPSLQTSRKLLGPCSLRIELQEQWISKKSIVTDLIAKGKVILQNPDKPKFLEGNVKRIEEGWDDTKKKAQDRLQLLNETKDAFIGYAENNETIASEFEVAEEEIKKVKKMFNLEAANADLKKRQDLLKKSTDTINGLFDSINANMATMSITIPEDKKKTLTKEIAAVKDKLEVNGRFA